MESEKWLERARLAINGMPGARLSVVVARLCADVERETATRIVDHIMHWAGNRAAMAAAIRKEFDIE